MKLSLFRPASLLLATVLLPLAGHAQTAVRCSDIATGGKNKSENANPANFTILDTRLFFTASDKSGNRGLYLKTLVNTAKNGDTSLADDDWTEKGNLPKLLKNFKFTGGAKDLDQFAATEEVSATSGNPIPTTAKLYFHDAGTGLWLTIGKTPVKLGAFDNPKNTKQEVTSMIPVLASSTNPLPLVYFGGWAKKTGEELYRSQGLVKNTKIVEDIVTGTNSSNPTSLVELNEGTNSTVFFVTGSGTALPQIWSTSTTDTNAASLVLTSTLGTPQQLVPSLDIGGSYFVLPGVGESSTNELWYTLSATNTAVQVTSGGLAPRNSTRWENMGDSVVFSGFDPVNFRQLWIANSEGGAQLLEVLNGNGNSDPSQITPAEFYLYFVASASNPTDNTVEPMLYVTDGTPNTDVPLQPVFNTVESNQYNFVNPNQITPVIDDSGSQNIYFVADGYYEDNVGLEAGTQILWVVPNDGFSEPQPVLDTNGNTIQSPTNLRSVVIPGVADRLYFSYDDGGGQGVEVWKAE